MKSTLREALLHLVVGMHPAGSRSLHAPLHLLTYVELVLDVLERAAVGEGLNEVENRSLDLAHALGLSQSYHGQEQPPSVH